jgi:hypothetical protein
MKYFNYVPGKNGKLKDLKVDGLTTGDYSENETGYWTLFFKMMAITSEVLRTVHLQHVNNNEILYNLMHVG